jgi:AcrR family transcriptional regulator
VVSDVDGVAAGEPTWQSRVVDRSMKRTEELARARALGSTTRIVEAATALAAESGGAGFTLQQVVDRAGVALQTFYRHFGSKDELMLAVVEEASRAEIVRIEEMAARETDPIGRLRVIMMTPFHTANRAVAGRLSATVSRELRRLREDYAEELAPLTAPYLALLEDAIRQVAAIGRISPEDPHRDAQLILGMAGAIFADVSTGSATYDRDAEEGYWWAFCLRALGADADLLAGARVVRAAN